MDKRKYNGGHKTAGRKTKSDEQELLEQMSPLDPLAFEKLGEALEQGHAWAVKIYFLWRWGKPKQRQEITLNQTETPLFTIDMGSWK